LTVGSKGDDVKSLQNYLISVNKGSAAAALAAVGATGFFGSLTRAALGEYQASAGVSPAAGYFGPKTRAYLASLAVTTPTGTQSVVLRIRNDNPGDARFDDISLYSVSFNSQSLLTGSGLRYIENGVTYYPVPQGWLAYAYPDGFDLTAALTSTTVAANGGAWAVPFELKTPMLLESASVRNSNTATERSWNWHLYYQKGNTGDSAQNTLDRVVAGVGETFTPSSASNRTVAATAATVIEPGAYWFLIQCTHASNNWNQGVGAAGHTFTTSGNLSQTKTVTNPAGATLDFVAATWTKSTEVPACRLNGRVFGQASAF